MSDLGSELIQAIRNKAAQNPDFVYEPPNDDSCMYVHHGEPSCLIGQGLWVKGLIGPELENMKVRVGLDAEVPNQTTVPILAGYLKLPLDVGEVEWLNMVQSYQDNNIPWGAAVEKADHAFVLAVA